MIILECLKQRLKLKSSRRDLELALEEEITARRAAEVAKQEAELAAKIADTKADELRTKLSSIALKSKLYCSFCSKSQDYAATLIQGNGVCICNECTLLCVEICLKKGNAA